MFFLLCDCPRAFPLQLGNKILLFPEMGLLVEERGVSIAFTKIQLLERSRAMVRSREDKPRQCNLSFFLNRSSLSESSLESLATSSLCKISFAISSWSFMFPTFLCPHLCKSLLRRCSFRNRPSTAQEHSRLVGRHQETPALLSRNFRSENDAFLLTEFSDQGSEGNDLRQ